MRIARRFWIPVALVLASGWISQPLSPLVAEESTLPSVIERDDPVSDGWTTEVIHEQVAQQWQRLAMLLAQPAPLQVSGIQELIDVEFHCPALRPKRLATLFRDRSISIARQSDRESDVEVHRGADGFVTALNELRPSGASDPRVKFKVFRIEPRGKSVVTRQFLSISGRRQGNYREIHTQWRAEWSRTADESGDHRPRLKSIQVVDYEEATSVKGPLFADCTEAVLGDNPCYQRQLVYGLDYWANRILQVDSSGMQGCAIGDVNGDGLDDVYLCQSSWLPNRLLIHTPDGRAVDGSAEAGVNWSERSHGALLIDLDNDGDEDLAVSTTVALLLMENDGTGKFTLRHQAIEARGAYSISAADYDLDGDLDIHTCVYLARALRRQILAAPVPFHDARNGGRNALLRNDGDWRFTDVTRETGLEEEATRRSLASAWDDYDNDGDSDLYVANDFGRNNLFRNDGGRFVDVAGAAGVADQSFGMSISWSDFNRDGWMDMYVANMFSAAGNRVVFQPQFRQHDSDVERQRFQYLARGNSLFQNNGDGTFLDVSEPANVMLGLWAWGSQFVDLNNDGYEDIVVANGYYSRSETHDL